MIIRFKIEAEKVLDALIAEYQLPDGLDGDDLRTADKHVYFMADMAADGDFLGETIAIEIEVKQ